MNTSTKRAATHRGSCQCCGSIQKLPAGLLSKHGYTVKWNFFQGVCRGAGARPFEKSTDLIDSFIAYAREKREALDAFRGELLARPAEGTTEAWVHVYRSARVTGKAGYQWMLLPLTFTPYSNDGHQWLQTQYQHPDDKAGMLRRLDLYALNGVDPLDRVAYLNQRRAAAVSQDIAKLDEYIRWQVARVAGWQEQELLPLEK